MGNQKNCVTRFISIFTLLWWSPQKYVYCPYYIPELPPPYGVNLNILTYE